MAIMKGLDNKAEDVLLTTMIREVFSKARLENPLWGKWCVDSS